MQKNQALKLLAERSRGRSCHTCEHYVAMPEDEMGECMYNPPTAFIVGAQPLSPLHNPQQQANMVPIVRAYFPVVSRHAFCGRYERRQDATH